MGGPFVGSIGVNPPVDEGGGRTFAQSCDMLLLNHTLNPKPLNPKPTSEVRRKCSIGFSRSTEIFPGVAKPCGCRTLVPPQTRRRWRTVKSHEKPVLPAALP